MVTQHGRNRNCFDVGIRRIAQLDLKEKTDLFFVTPFSILELLLPSFPQFSFKFGVILENNRSSKSRGFGFTEVSPEKNFPIKSNTYKSLR